jgi:hypothetical protein
MEFIEHLDYDCFTYNPHTIEEAEHFIKFLKTLDKYEFDTGNLRVKTTAELEQY